jgi:hypothetical protein
MTTLIPPGPGANVNAVLQSFYDAMSDLQNPGQPVTFAHVALKADLPKAAAWPECGIICDEINSLVVSTKVTGAYAWLRADGSAL